MFVFQDVCSQDGLDRGHQEVCHDEWLTVFQLPQRHSPSRLCRPRVSQESGLARTLQRLLSDLLYAQQYPRHCRCQAALHVMYGAAWSALESILAQANTTENMPWQSG